VLLLVANDFIFYEPNFTAAIDLYVVSGGPVPIKRFSTICTFVATALIKVLNAQMCDATEASNFFYCRAHKNFKNCAK